MPKPSENIQAAFVWRLRQAGRHDACLKIGGDTAWLTAGCQSIAVIIEEALALFVG